MEELPPFTKSVKLTPWFAFDPGRFRLPEPNASPAVGVGTFTRVGVQLQYPSMSQSVACCNKP
jgi:hypothetical protein